MNRSSGVKVGARAASRRGDEVGGYTGKWTLRSQCTRTLYTQGPSPLISDSLDGTSHRGPIGGRGGIGVVVKGNRIVINPMYLDDSSDTSRFTVP